MGNKRICTNSVLAFDKWRSAVADNVQLFMVSVWSVAEFVFSEYSLNSSIHMRHVCKLPKIQLELT